MRDDLPQDIQKELGKKREIVGETKLQQERLRKKEMQKAEDVLDEIGQKDERRGVKAAQKAYADYQKESFTIKSERIEWLNKKAKFSKGKRLDYFQAVKVLVDYELSWLRLPHGYAVKSEVTLYGVKLILTDRWGNIHMGGFAPCGLGLYDEQACRTSVNKLDDKIRVLEENPQSGIYLP